MSNNNYYTIKSTVEFNFTNSHLCEISYNSFLPELDERKSKRSKMSMEKKDSSLIFNIESKDITAFRATINEIIGFGKIINNSLRIAHI
ncbi:MAG: KEOPS complex subunit Pcc1 [Promethearchaeota archaeon]|jgi:tRNA threonylcarbamoyladenosine modification (KEOPS) complex  Pcc1 subunit